MREITYVNYLFWNGIYYSVIKYERLISLYGVKYKSKAFDNVVERIYL